MELNFPWNMEKVVAMLAGCRSKDVGYFINHFGPHLNISTFIEWVHDMFCPSPTVSQSLSHGCKAERTKPYTTFCSCSDLLRRCRLSLHLWKIDSAARVDSDMRFGKEANPVNAAHMKRIRPLPAGCYWCFAGRFPEMWDVCLCTDLILCHFLDHWSFSISCCRCEAWCSYSFKWPIREWHSESRTSESTPLPEPPGNHQYSIQVTQHIYFLR